MNALIKQEVKALRNMGYNSIFYFPTTSSSKCAQFIDCFVPGRLCVDVYSWEREVTGVGNDGRDWDIGASEARQLVIPFVQTRAGFRKAYRLARLCVQLPRKWRLY
ncbi:hypothetical protein ACEV6Q_06915 [Enterobacter ludwigii]|uniref:hypothetical protein n=1 Tax=Enterobacter ludwigii TaxID=299767 RepID=UPI003BEF2F34